MGAALDQWNNRNKQNRPPATVRGGSALDAWNSGRADRMSQSMNRLNTGMQSLQKQTSARKSYWDGNDQSIRSQAESMNRLMQQIESEAQRYGITDAYDASVMEQYKKYNTSVLSALDADAQRYGQFKTEEEYNNHAKTYAEQQEKQTSKEQNDPLNPYRQMSTEQLRQNLAALEAGRAAEVEQKYNPSNRKGAVTQAVTRLKDSAVRNPAEKSAGRIGQAVRPPEQNAEIENIKTVLKEREQEERTEQIKRMPSEAVKELDRIADAWDAIDVSGVREDSGGGVQKRAAQQIEWSKNALKRMGYNNWEELADTWRRQRNAERVEQERQAVQQSTREHPWTENAYSVIEQGARGVSGIVDLATVATGGEIDVNDQFHAAGRNADTVRGTTQEMIDEKFDSKAGKTAARVAYNVGMGVADNLVRMGLGYAAGGAAYASTISGALMGSQVMSQAIVEGKQKGYSDEKAVGMALVQAVIEAATEKWSVEKVLKDSKNVFLQVGKGMLAEGSEEVMSNVANYIADVLANGDENDLHQAYDRYRMQGKSDKDALKSVIWDVVGENAESFLVGGLSGAVLGAGSSVAFDQRRKMYGDLMIQSGEVNNLLDDAEGRDDKELKKYVDKVKDKEKPSARAVGNLVLRLDELGEDKAAIVEKYISGKRLSEEDRKAVRDDPEVQQMIEDQGAEPERRAVQEGDVGYQALMSYAKQYKDTGAEQSFKDNYRAGQNIDAYAAGYNAVWQAGVDGDRFETVEAWFNGEWTSEFTREQAIEAHRAGYMEGMAAVSEPFDEIQVENNGADVIRSAELKNGVTLVNVQKRIDATKRTQLAVLQNFGKEKGIAFAVVDESSGRYGNINGEQIGGTNKIIVNLDAEGGLLLRTAGHEVFHYIEQQSADAAQKLRDFVVEHYVKEGSYESLAQKYAQQGYTGDIDSELTADNLFDVMTQEGFLQKYAAEDANTVRTLRNTVAAFIRHINNALKKLRRTNPIHREIYNSLNKDKQFLEKLRKMASDALDSLPNAQSGNRSDAKRSEGDSQAKTKESKKPIRYDYSKSFGEQIKDYIDGKYPRAEHLLVCKTPEIWQKIGLNALPVTINQKSVKRALLGTRDADHFIGETMLRNLPRLLADPVAIIRSQAEATPDSLVVIIAQKINGHQVIAAVTVDSKSLYQKDTINSNLIHSIYGKTESLNQLKLAVEFDSPERIELYYWNKKEAFNLMRAEGLQLPSNTQKSGFIHSIDENGSIVKKKLNSVTDSLQFKRWFGGSKVKNADGTPKVMYRGGAETINVFDRKKSRASNLYGRGFYFTEDKSAAARYGDVREYFLRIEHPLTPGKHTLKKEQFRRFLLAIENGYDEDWDLYNYGENYSIDALADSFAKKGDFEALQDISATAVGDLAACIEAFNEINGTKYDGIILPTETIVFDSKQIKSATDNIGTFDKNNPDIRFSLKPASSISEENRRLIEENETYKAVIGKLNRQIAAMQKKVVDPKGVRKLARDVRAEYQSKIPQADLEQKLTDLFDYIANERDIDFGEITRVTAEIAKDVISQSDALNTELTEQYADLRNRLKTTKIQLTSLQKSEMAVQFDSYENFRRKNLNRIRFAKDGIKLDELWGELSEAWPEFFKADEHEAEMPLRLMEAIEATNPFHENPYGMNMDETAYDLALRIYDAYYDIPEVGSLQRQINDLRAEYVARMERKGLSETRRRAVSQVLQSANALAKKLAANSAKKNVPDALKKPVMGLLDTISAYSESGRVTELNKSFFENLRKAHERLTDIYKDGTEKNLIQIYEENLDITEDYLEDVRRLRRDMDDLLERYGKDKKHILQMMDLDQLDDLNRVLVQMHHMVTRAGELYQNELYKNANDLSRDTIRELSEMKERVAHRFENGETIETFLGWTNATPYYVFKRFGAAGLSIFNEMQKGWDTFAFHIRDVRDYAQSVYTEKEVRAWEKDVRVFKDATGKEFRLTIPQVMSIFCLTKRDAAKRHLLGGGITPGKVGKYQQSQRYKQDQQTLDAIVGALSPRQIEVADKLQAFMSTTCADWGNAVSMKRFGVRLFTENFYFPMAVDQNTVKGGDTPKLGNGLFDLINRSFTKELNDNASNALYAQDIFDVFTAHASDMAQYNALALPVLDMMKWYNGTVSTGEQTDDAENTGKQNVKAEIERVYGKQAKEYIDQFVRDINGTTSEDRMHLDKKLMRNFKIAKVAANLNVALVQPTAYMRAANVIDPKYLISAMSGLKLKELKVHIKEMQQYSGIGLWKSMGFFDVDINRSLSTMIKYGDRTVDKVREASMKGAEWMDNMTWGLLFYACQKWAYKEKNLPFGSKACNEAAAEKFREVVYATQVVDSTMTRSALMRSKSGLDQAVSAFMSEPTLSYNMLMDQAFEWQKGARSGLSVKENWKKNGKPIMRAVATYCISAVVTAAFEAVSGALRDEDDDKGFWEKYLDSGVDNLISDLSVVQKIPRIKYLSEVVQAIWEKKSFSDSNPYTQTFKEFTSAINAMRSGNFFEYKNVYKLLTFLSGASGLPASNLIRDVVAIWNTTVGAAMPEYKLHRYDVSQKEKILKFADGDDVRDQTQKMLQDKIKARQKQYPYETRQKAEKEAKSGLKSSLTSAAKELYQSGDTKAARRLMQQSGLYEADDIRKNLDKWAKE